MPGLTTDGGFSMIKVFSFGGGVQSTACLVLAAQGIIDYQTFLFCNVGADSENPDTLTYVEEIAKPYAAKHGLALHELQKIRRDGSVDTIYSHLRSEEHTSELQSRLHLVCRLLLEKKKLLFIPHDVPAFVSVRIRLPLIHGLLLETSTLAMRVIRSALLYSRLDITQDACVLTKLS